MKTYRQLLEDIQLEPNISRLNRKDWKGIHDEFHSDIEAARSLPSLRMHKLGKIHKEYSIHRNHNGNDFFITHDKSKKVVGHIENDHVSDNPETSKHLRVGFLAIHPHHSKKKIGHSLAVAAYKHLHGKHGYTIHSGIQQSMGGASVWQHLMKDPKTKKHVRAVVSRKGDEDIKDIGQASKMNPADIWTSGSGGVRRKAASKGIRMHDYSSPKATRAFGTQLILKAKKK
jgi:hypothetical protein